MPVVLSNYKYRFDKAKFTAVRLAYSNLGIALLHLQNRLQRRQISYKADSSRAKDERRGGAL